MRLLESTADDQFTLQQYTSTQIPPYAILSHTWDEGEEVSFQDILNGTNKRKQGWRKIKFCMKQAKSDGVSYVWIDTCCIDQRNSVELSEAINSMFRWYGGAARCYVYLSDVSVSRSDAASNHQKAWEHSFKTSRWFTRGWTLPELLAPSSVNFYAATGEKLGDKSSLAMMIQDITGIPQSALQGVSLTNFSIGERLGWAEGRQTTHDEDQVYSLLGIFDASMSIIYGEGRKNALRRLSTIIQQSFKGLKFDQFSVGLDLAAIPQRIQFIARESELRKMHDMLYGHKTRALVVLQGVGGIGKTQLALEYAMRHLDEYSAIFWLKATNADSLSLSFNGTAGRILNNRPSTVELLNADSVDDLEEAVRAVITWLERGENTEWLLVYDDVNTTALDIRDFLPHCDHGSIIITTRSVGIGIGSLMRLSSLSTHDSLEILSKASGRSYLENTERTDYDALVLAQELDGLPLALAAAGAYLKKSAMSYAQYLELYRKSLGQLQLDHTSMKSSVERSIYLTLQISFNSIEQRHPLSAQVLRLWAYLDRQDVWYELLRTNSSTAPRWSRELISDELDFNAAMNVLYSFGFIDSVRGYERFGLNGYCMHGYVHSWTISVLNEKWDESLARLALTCVASAIPSTAEKDRWITQRRLLPHAMRLVEFIVDGKLKTQQMQLELRCLGDLCADQGKFVQAETMYTRAIQSVEGVIVPTDTQTLDSVTNLGNLYTNLGRLDEAMNMYEQAIRGHEKAFGPDHPSTLGTINNLGNLYTSQGKLGQAEEMYLRTLRGYEKSLGPEHTRTLDTINNLGNLYTNLGRLEEAEEMYLRALQGYEKAFGPDHPSTLDTINNLGNLYTSQGKLGQAEQMYQRALRGYEKQLGPDHTTTLGTVNNLGNLYADQGRLDQAEKMYQRALWGYEEALGPDHMSTLDAINNLGILYRKQGKLDEAEQMYQRALRRYEKQLGPDHTTTLGTVNNLGNLYADQGRLDQAEEMYQRALLGYKQGLGANHFSTLDVVNNLGNIYADQGRLDLAEEMYEQVLRGHEKQLGTDHPSVDMAMANLGATYRNQGRCKEAEELQTRVMEKYLIKLGHDHPDSLTAMANLASTYWVDGRWNEAEELNVQVLEARGRKLGKSHPSTLTTMSNLASLYLNQGRLKEAEELNINVLEASEKVLGDAHPDTLIAMSNLASTYLNQGRLKEAEELNINVLEAREMMLGIEHPSTLTTMSNLVSIYLNQGRLKEAEELNIKVLEASEKMLGIEHTSTLTTMSNLASIYLTQGRLEEAEKLEVEVLSTRRQGLGDTHPDTLRSIGNLASIYLSQGRLEEAEQLQVEKGRVSIRS